MTTKKQEVKEMTKQKESVEVRADTTLLVEAMDELVRLAKLSKSFLSIIQSFFDRMSNVELVSFEQATTVRTGNLILVIKPSNKLLEFTTTLRTRETELFASDVK